MKRFSRVMNVIAVVFSNLMHRQSVADSLDEQLVLDALRRSNQELKDASVSELGNYLSSLNMDQLRGLASNVQGIYHELRYVHDFNATHPNLKAEVFPATNHPGSDVVIRDTATGEIVQELQLKASNDADYALEGFSGESGIALLGTTEMAKVSEVIGDSGYANAELQADVASQFEQVGGLTLSSQLVEGAETSGLVGAALRGYDILKGGAAPLEGAKAIGVDVAIATGTTAFVDLLFS